MSRSTCSLFALSLLTLAACNAPSAPKVEAPVVDTGSVQQVPAAADGTDDDDLAAQEASDEATMLKDQETGAILEGEGVIGEDDIEIQADGKLDDAAMEADDAQ